MKKPNSLKTVDLLHRRSAPLATRTDLSAAATKDIAAAMNAILADVRQNPRKYTKGMIKVF